MKVKIDPEVYDNWKLASPEEWNEEYCEECEELLDECICL